MNTRKILAAAAALMMVAGFSSCKPKESAYKAAYERAKQREVAQAEEQDNVQPVITTTDDDSVRSERINPAAGEDANGLRAYSVVIGSFQNITNARSLKERMVGEGFGTAILAQNEQGMYRVIVSSFDTKDEAVSSREQIKQRFTPLFSDAWILQRAY